MAKDINEIKNSLISSLLSNESNADIQDGSLIRDIAIDPQSLQISNLYDVNDYVKLLAAWKNNAENLLEEDLDAIGNNLDVERKPATYATCIITFRTKTLPTKRIRIGNENGTGGVQIKSMNLEDDSYYQFSTTKTVYMETDTKLDETSGFYEVSAPCTAVLAGPESNVGVGTLIIMETPISGIESVYNYVAATGGSNIQNNASYAEDMSIAIQGATKNTENGIIDILNELDNISEVKIFNPNSEESSKTGTVYAYIKTDNEELYSENFIYSVNSNNYKLTKRPIKRIESVKAYYNGIQRECIENIDYYLKKDESSLYKYSINSNDSIVFNFEQHPDNNTEVVVNYIYVKKVEDAQNLILEKENDILILGNIIVKTSQPVLVDLTLNVKLKYGYNTDENQNSVISGIQNYINSFKMGEDLTAVELFSYLVSNFDYIETINYPFAEFKKRNDNTSSEEITTVYGEYLTVDENSIKIIFE